MSDTNTPAASGDQPYDQADEFAESEQIATNDAVAGETVFPGVGEGNDGPPVNDLGGNYVDLEEME